MQFGSYDVVVVRDGSYRLDGGSMFGVVPRVLWEKFHAPDDQNRIEIALNCLLVRGEGRVILVDNGMGHGWSDRERKIYGLTRDRGDLVEDLARHDVTPDQVTDMILTHLHFDHAGGTVQWDGDDTRLTFPNATHWLQRQNLRWGEEPTERDRASYRRERWELLLADERFRLLDGPGEILPEIEALVVNGHTPGQQLILIGRADSDRLLYCGDLIPFESHLRLPYIMAFDLNPVITLTEKKNLLTRAATEGWVLAFEHDPAVDAIRIAADDGRFSRLEAVTL